MSINPCPCCSSKAALRMRVDPSNKVGYFIRCTNEKCGVQTEVLSSETLARAVWAKRPLKKKGK